MSAEASGLSRRYRRCAVIGSPITASLSPALHRAAYRSLGLAWDYDGHDVPAGSLPEFLESLTPQWRGLSVTMPLKREMAALCDSLEPVAAQVAAVNTVVLEADGERSGYNTDVTGLVASLAASGVDTVESAVLVGAGATAASAMAAMAAFGADSIRVLARSPQRAGEVKKTGQLLGVEVEVFGLDNLRGAQPGDVLVSTIPADAQPPYAAELARLAPVVFDVVYAPWRTPLMTAAEDAGARTVHGFELLLHQAGRQVELMTGAPAAPLQEMRAAGLAAVASA